ncbi:VUT family protein [Paenibacillus flagellatus]|uniref:VUT family protein n=1 Tax=Paenibacillus flagellatus TaxID=2211139 RepID=A0A2V5KEM7_9BACL|nr:VUT family protein [Paenibacillus flagellatus]PYI57592.1 hypothetical protein DLM86_03210 [Paenibacillus flagellatus]
MLIALYLLSIVCANVVTASFAPMKIGAMIVPMGSLLIGATFVLRDFVQRAVGRKKTYAAIAAAMLLSLATSYVLGDTLWIVFASAVTFLVSETTDTELYTRLKLPMSLKVLYSGLVGGIVDSALFVVIGLSPLGAGFLPWEAVGYAIVGQVLIKTAMQCLGAAGIAVLTRPGRSADA